MIRIIAGSFRGRWVRTPEGLEVRPILARIRKSLFDIIAPIVGDSVFLDLYCGCGVVGIEALSRGARFAGFVDLSEGSIKVTKKNLENLGLYSADTVCVLRADATKGQELSYLSRVAPGKFDIIFMGPPYKDPQTKAPLALVLPTLTAVLSSGILASGGIIIAQHHIKEVVEAPDRLSLYRRKKYGDSALTFFKLKI